MHKKTFEEVSDKWDKGEHVFSDIEDALITSQEGEEIGHLFNGMTKCPVSNASCHNYIIIKMYGFCPTKPGKIEEIWLCPFGAKNIGDCKLSK
jgi:hypothetical protein